MHGDEAGQQAHGNEVHMPRAVVTAEQFPQDGKLHRLPQDQSGDHQQRHVEHDEQVGKALHLVVDAQALALLSQISRLQAELQLCDAALATEQRVQASSQTDFYLFYDLAIASFNCQRNAQGSAYIKQAMSYGYPAQLIAADPKIPHTGQ